MSSSITQPGCITERVLVQWQDLESKTPCYLGSKDNDFRMTVRLSTQSNTQLLLWFHLPVAVKLHPQSNKSRRRSLYFVIQADMFDRENEVPCLSVQPLQSSDPLDSTYIALDYAKLAPNDDISCLSFRLRTCGKVFMPSARVFPVSDNVSNALTNLKSLSCAKTFDVYLAFNNTDSSVNESQNTGIKLLEDLCKKVSAGEMENHTIDFSTCYSEGMVCDSWENLDLGDEKTVLPEQNPRPYSTGELYNVTIGPEYAAKDQQKLQSTATQPMGLQPPQYDEAISSINQEDIETEDDDLDADHISLITNKKRKADSISSDTSRISKQVHFAPLVEVVEPPASTADPPSSWEHILQYLEDVAATASFPAHRQGSSSANSVPTSLKHQLADHVVWLYDIDYRLLKEYDSALWKLGDAAISDNTESFGRIIASSMTKIICKYTSSRRRSTPNSTNSMPAPLRHQLTEHIFWLRKTDYDLLREYDGLLWRLGDTANRGDKAGFARIVAACMADVICKFRKR